MEKLSIYEYVAVIVPGVAFLFGLGAMLPDGYLYHAVLLPHDMGTATVHLFLAFALGHMLQVLGQLSHRRYWADFGGLPTDWPFTRQHKELSPELIQLVGDVSGQGEISDLDEWRHAVSAVRSLVSADGFARRLETFHANYGMFRSLAVAASVLLFVAPWCELSLWASCPIIGVVLVVSLIGMHAFGVHYARELFGAARAWDHKQATNEVQVSIQQPTAGLKVYPRRAPRDTRAA